MSGKEHATIRVIAGYSLATFAVAWFPERSTQVASAFANLNSNSQFGMDEEGAAHLI